NNRIFVAGNQTAIRKVKKMVAILDQSADEQRKITLVEILHSDAKNVARILNKVFKGSSKKNKKQHKQEIIALERSNHLLVIGTPPFTARVKKMVEDLDQASESLVLEIIPVKNAEAESLATLLEGIFQKSTSSKKTNTKQIQVFADKRTNKLLILANKSSLKKIKNIIKELDIPTGGGGMIGNFRVFQLKNAKSKHVAEVLQKVSGSFQQLGKKNKKSKSTISSSSNSSGFKIVADEETNSIVVFAQPTQFLSIERVIQRLDIVRPQVFFEALIMEVTIDKTFSLNINWQANALTQSGSNRGMITMNDPNSRGVPTGLSSTLPTGQENSSFGLLGPIINFNGVEFPSFQSFVKAVQKNTNIDILSNPQLLTMANQEATINVGETRPFIKEITIDSNNNERQSVEYRDVGIKLKILPQVNANNTITLKIDETTSEVKTGTLDSDKFPITLTRTINTSVTIADGKTVVLGGLINDTIDISETKTPCLGDIPLLGWFFKGKSKTRKKTNLLVFITPRIIRTKEDLKKISFRTSERFKSSKKGNFRVNVAKEFRMPSLVKEPKKRKALEREIWEYQEGK
ncbi:MAG: general secretion pathway protein D, partial [bacterium]